MTFSKPFARVLVSVVAFAISILSVGCKVSGVKKAPMATFFVDSVRPGDTAVAVQNEWGLPRVRKYNLTACLRDTAQLQSVIDQPFEIRDEVGNSIPVMTDFRGCFVWVEAHEFDFFAPESFVVVRREIVAKGSHAGTEVIDLAFNPWRPGGVVDLRFDTPVGLTERKAEPQVFSSQFLPGPQVKISSRLIVGRDSDSYIDLKSIAFERLPTNYDLFEVDPLLNLTVVHQYRIRLTPSIFRQTIERPWLEERPNVGKLKLTIVLAREAADRTDAQIDPSQIVSTWSGEINYVAGVITHDIALKFADVSATASRLRAVVTIEPVLSGTSLRGATFSAQFGPLPAAMMVLMPETRVGFDLVQRLARVESELPVAPFADQLNPLGLLADTKLSGLRQITPEQWSSRPADVRGARAMRSRTGVTTLDFEKLEEIIEGKNQSRGDAQLMARQFCEHVYGSSDGEAAETKSTEPTRRERGGWFSSGLFGGGRSLSTPEERIEACRNSPQNFLAVQGREMVESLRSTRPRRAGLFQSETLVITNAITISETRTEGESDRWTKFGYGIDGSLGASAGIAWGPQSCVPVPTDPTQPEGPKACPTKGIWDYVLQWFSGDGWLPRAGFNANVGGTVRMGYNYDWFRTWARQTARGTTIANSVNRTLLVDGMAFDIDANVKRCLLVGPAGSENGSTNATQAVASGVFVCSRKAAPKTAREAYYFISQQGPATSPIVDTGAAEEMPFRLFIRGVNNFESLKETLKLENVELVLEKVDEPGASASSDKAVAHRTRSAFRVNQDFPGMLSVPRAEPRR